MGREEGSPLPNPNHAYQQPRQHQHPKGQRITAVSRYILLPTN